MKLENAKKIFEALPENEQLALIEKVMPNSGVYRQHENKCGWSDSMWELLATTFQNSIDWEQGLLMEKICYHDKTYVVSGESELGNKYEAIGFYSDGTLLFIDDLSIL